jgi:phosphate transport system protein
VTPQAPFPPIPPLFEYSLSFHALAIFPAHPVNAATKAAQSPQEAPKVASTKTSAEGIFQSVLVNYLISQARTVEASVNRALWALLERNERLASEVFLTEPRINEMEILIDEHAIRMLRQGEMLDSDVRLIVATLKINNDLERMGDLAVNLSERAISLAQMGEVHIPIELEPMTTAVRAMVSKCLGALIYQNVDLATQVLESDDVVDQYRDQVFEALLAGMTENPALAAPNLHYVLASRHLERIADHATNIAEDILFWVRGLEVRHGRAKQMELNAGGPASSAAE